MAAIEKKLSELGITLPAAAKPAANYVSYVVSGKQVIISGQVPFVNGSVEGQVGKLGADCDLEKGKKIARICGINILAQLKAACDGDLEKVKRCVRLGVFVNATDDFKDHPEAFISLQREASRQQKLAHPNIATIYDFDRVGGPNTPVYITMELMEGMELKDFIKKKVRPKGGLPFDEAFEIVKQLGAGLTYAHNLRLVHSDFKPGNAFMCDDGTKSCGEIQYYCTVQ